MSKIRKAFAAFLTAAAGTVVARLATDGMPADGPGWFALAGAAAGVGLAAAYAVWQVPNAPAVSPPADGAVRRSY